MSIPKKKIVIAAEIFPPEIGGPATYARSLADALVKDGINVSVVTYARPHKNTENTESTLLRQGYGGQAENTYDLHTVSMRIPFLLRQVVYFLKLLGVGWKADVIYAQGPSVGPAAIYLKKFRHMRVAVKYVGDQSWQQLRVKGNTVGFEEYMETFGKKFWDIKTWFIQRWQRFAFKHADAVITPSNYLKHILYSRLNVNGEDIHVISNSVSVPDSPVLPNPESKQVLYFGRVENWKGIEALIDAIEDMPDYTLVVAGDGHMRPAYERIVKRKKLESRVTFAGRIAHDQLKKYFSESLCYVLGSEYEGMPFSVLEAWAHRLPVVVSDFPANTELVTDEETGLVFSYGNTVELKTAISRLAVNTDLREKLVQNAFVKVKEYGFERMVQETKKILGL